MEFRELDRRNRSAGKRRRGSLGKEWKQFRLRLPGYVLHLAARAGWGYSLWSWDGPKGFRLAWGECPSYKEMEGMKKKKKADAASTAKHLAALESTLFAAHHSIVAHCGVTQYDDGDPRQPGWITVKTFGSVWQVEAKDPDTCQFMRVTQPTLDDALTLLALLLDSEDAPWEHDPWAAQQKARKKK